MEPDPGKSELTPGPSQPAPPCTGDPIWIEQRASRGWEEKVESRALRGGHGRSSQRLADHRCESVEDPWADGDYSSACLRLRTLQGLRIVRRVDRPFDGEGAVLDIHVFGAERRDFSAPEARARRDQGNQIDGVSLECRQGRPQ